MISAPSVSAIIPVLDGEVFLSDAVASIQSQQPPVAEIIIVDGGSKDGTGAVADGFGEAVRFVQQYPMEGGLAAARNTGVRLANGEVIAFLDVDDLWSGDKARIQLGYLSANPSADIILGQTQKMRFTGTQAGKLQFENWSSPELALSMGAGLFRRAVFDTVGAFDEALPFTCDWDWFMRAREKGIEMRTHPETVQFYRRHGNNKTEQVKAGNHDTMVMLKKSLLRRRKETGGQADSLPPISAADAPDSE